MSGNIRLPIENIEDAKSRRVDLDRRREQTADAATFAKSRRAGIVDRLISRFRSRRDASG